MTGRGPNDPPDGCAVAEVKATVLRALAASLETQGIRVAIAAHVSPSVRRMLGDLPGSTAWIDARVLIEIQDAVHTLFGAPVLREVQRRAIERGVLPILRSAAESALRLFGGSPATLLSRMPLFAGSTTRGIVYRYTATSETSGLFEVEHVGLRDLPMAPFIATGGAAALFLEICGVEGTISEPEMLPNGLGNAARFEVSWRAPR